MRAHLVLAAASSLFFATTLAAAAGDDAKRAEGLYDEALALADAGNFAAACPKYAASQKLDPALGTQFNLADCWEHTGLLASAYTNFLEVERAARAAGKANLATRAHDRAAALEKRVPRLSIKAPVVSQLVVRVDGVILADDALGFVPVDAGKHVVEASAPGYRPWRGEVTAGGAATTVAIPELTPTDGEPKGATEMRPARSWRIAGATAAGVGVVGVVLGSVSGMNALAKRDEAREVCQNDSPSQCHDRAGVAIWDDAGTAGNISTIAFAAGAALIVTGAVLWLVAPSRPVTTNAALGRLAFGGTF